MCGVILVLPSVLAGKIADCIAMRHLCGNSRRQWVRPPVYLRIWWEHRQTCRVI